MSGVADNVPTMAKATQTYRCAECGWTTAKWVGRCGECQAWGTVEEVGATRAATTVAATVTSPARPIGSVEVEVATSRATGVGEFDRALGGGLVQGAVVLLAGEPGVGKSTLLLEVASRWARDSGRALYVTGEESAAQVRLRAERTDALADHLMLTAETDLATVLGHIDQVAPSLLIIDSVQTIASAGVDGAAGGVTQVREVAGAVIREAKARGIATVLVGHVTKEGSIAGPRLLEHLVDVVLHFEGDRHSRLRMVRTVKNRYGPADEVGCFDLTDSGIVSLPDPTGLFVSDHMAPVAGTCVTVTLEGRRPLLGEVQSLVAPSMAGAPRRANNGLDSARVSMIIAVLERRGRMPMGGADIYTSTVGGARVTEPAADLAILLALASAVQDRPIIPGMIAIGEVGLAGEIRRVTGIQRRLAEAARLGVASAIVPPDTAGVSGLRTIEVETVSEALKAAHRAVHPVARI